jgi:hypothetical protein
VAFGAWLETLFLGSWFYGLGPMDGGMFVLVEGMSLDGFLLFGWLNGLFACFMNLDVLSTLDVGLDV